MFKKRIHIFSLFSALIIVILILKKCYNITGSLGAEEIRLRNLTRVRDEEIIKFKYVDVLNLMDLNDNLKIENIDMNKLKNTINMKISFTGTEIEFSTILDRIKEKENLIQIKSINIDRAKEGGVKAVLDLDFTSIKKI